MSLFLNTQQSNLAAQKWGLAHPGTGGHPGLLVLLSLSLWGCGDPLKFPQDLEETRVLGIQVVTEDGRSWPSEGETAEANILIAGPDGPREVSVAYNSCSAVASSWGVPICGDSILSEGTTEHSASPSFDFKGLDTEDDSERFAILAVACESGDPKLEAHPDDWHCSDDSNALRFSFETNINGIENLVPVLEESVAFYDDRAATPGSASQSGSCEDALSLEPKKTFAVRFELDNRAREENEILQISHYSSQGRFERQYSILYPEDDPSVTLEFETPEELGLIKSYLVVRDGSGGTGWLAWDICVDE